MYNAELLKTRIKLLCKDRGLALKDVLAACDLSINVVSRINDAGGMYSFSLARIADVLDVSVDYLLGRTDKMEVNR